VGGFMRPQYPFGVLRMARALAPRAIERLSELLESEDERVAAVACNALLGHAFGKPREHPASRASIRSRRRCPN
jgi:hypothetical protein